MRLTSHQGYRRTHRLPSWLKILSAAVLLLLTAKLPTSEEVDYCAIETLNCQRGTHTMCLFRQDGPGPTCSDYQSTRLSQSEIEAIVDKHNDLRNNIALGNVPPFKTASNMMELSWDEELATIAQRWADQCIFYGHDICRDLPERFFLVGQNIAVENGSPQLLGPPQSQVQRWYDEIRDYRYGPGPFRSTGHFTQVVWALTDLIGCGRSRFSFNGSTHQLLVCNYGPAGNLVTHPIYREGEPCSQCTCSDRYPGLCAPGSRINDNDNAGSSTVPTYAEYQPSPVCMPCLLL